MSKLNQFLQIIRTEFDDDRLTYQKAIPTFHPESSEEAARLFKLANEQKQPLFITGFGNNIDPQGEKFNNILSIRTDRLNHVVEVQPDDYYITVGAGYPLREVNKRLKEVGLWLPHGNLPYVGSCAGAIACDLTADYQGHDLPLKKYFIKAEIVTPNGELITPGSTCFKSVSGFDIVKIFAGSWGLLGLIVSATFRVMPESGAADYGAIKQKAHDRNHLIKALDHKNSETDAVYTQKIKTKFDPNSILPLL